MNERESMDSGRWRCGEDRVERNWGGGTIPRIDYIKEKIQFQKQN